MPPTAGVWSGTVEWLSLLGSVMRIALAPRWHRRAVKLSLLTRIGGYIGAGAPVLQWFCAGHGEALRCHCRDWFRFLREFSWPQRAEPAFRKRIGLSVLRHAN